MPAGAHDGGPDDGDVELVLLLLHHKLGQGFGVGVGVGPVADEPRRDVAHDAVVHPPADATDGGGGEEGGGVRNCVQESKKSCILEPFEWMIGHENQALSFSTH